MPRQTLKLIHSDVSLVLISLTCCSVEFVACGTGKVQKGLNRENHANINKGAPLFYNDPTGTLNVQ